MEAELPEEKLLGFDKIDKEELRIILQNLSEKLEDVNVLYIPESDSFLFAGTIKQKVKGMEFSTRISSIVYMYKQREGKCNLYAETDIYLIKPKKGGVNDQKVTFRSPYHLISYFTEMIEYETLRPQQGEFIK